MVAEDRASMTETTISQRQAERLATLAALARPAQHELNNLLHVIYANLELLKRSAAEGAPQRQLDRVEQAARRLEATSQALLHLTRRPLPAPPGFAPAETLAALAPLLRLLLPAPGALALALPEGEAAPVAGDRGEFEETLLGLARQAGAVMPPGGSLGLALTAEATAMTLRIAWPAGAPLPHLPGAEALPDGLLLHWPRI
jgi:signal transduction histidine kinase